MPSKRPKRKTGSPADAMPGDMRRTDLGATRPDDLPDVDSSEVPDVAAGGGYSPQPDGGVDQHPIHDEDQEDAGPSDYEREIDRLDAAVRSGR